MPSGNVSKSHLIKDRERPKKTTKKKQFKLQIKGKNQWEMLHHGIIMMTRNTDFYPLLDLKYTPLQTCAWQLQKPWTSSCSYYFTFSSAWRKNAVCAVAVLQQTNYYRCFLVCAVWKAQVCYLWFSSIKRLSEPWQGPSIPWVEV